MNVFTDWEIRELVDKMIVAGLDTISAAIMNSVLLIGTMLVLVLIGTVIVLWIISKRNRNRDEPPVMSGSKILIGNALIYAGNSKQLWNTLKNIHKEATEAGGAIKTTIGPRTMYHVTDPEDAIKVADACLQKDTVYDFGKKWLGVGLVTASASEWKVHRKLINPAFSQHVLDSFIHIFNKQSRHLVEKINKEAGKGPFDFTHYGESCALQIICSTALGIDFEDNNAANLELVETMLKMSKSVTKRFQSIFLHNNFLFNLSSLKREQDGYIKILHNVSETILRQRKKILLKKKEEDLKVKLFMDILLKLGSFTDQEIREHVDTFISTGEDTSSTVLLYSILLVGSYPQVQEKIHEELKNVFGDEDRDVTKKDLSQLVYLEAVLKESMRLYSIVPTIGRILEEDVKLRNSTLLKGNSVFLFLYGINRHSMWGPDAEEFKPERWLDPSTLPHPKYASASFGLGRRNCIGKTFALMSLKVIMAHFCRNYMVYSDHSKLILQMHIVLKPASGHHITIEKRS